MILVKNGRVTSAKNCTLNVNDLGAKPIYYSTAAATRVTTHFNSAYTWLLIYDSTRVDGGCWVAYWGYYSDSNTIPSAYCTTAAGTAAKAASFSGYALLDESHFMLVISTTNTVKGAITLNVNSKGAKPIYINGTASSASNYTMPAGTYFVYYDGTNYYVRTDGKITGSITGDAETVNDHTVNADVPSDAKFTDTTYTASTTSIGSASAGTAISADDITAWTTNTPTAVTKKTVVTSASGATAAYADGILTITNGSFTTGDSVSVTAGTAASLSYTSRSIPNISVTSKTVATGITAN